MAVAEDSTGVAENSSRATEVGLDIAQETQDVAGGSTGFAPDSAGIVELSITHKLGMFISNQRPSSRHIL